MSDIFESARINDHKSIEKLISEECSPNDRDDFGRTALHISATYGCEEATQILISSGWNNDVIIYIFIFLCS